jgi:hypothetical protein
VATHIANIPRLSKDFAPISKEIRFLNKTFPEFRQSLIDFAKVYFPDSYTDFNEASPGMMFIEMTSYIGDVLSYYIDNQFRENLVNFAQENESIISIAQAFGYKPKPAAAASTIADMFQLVPALASGSGFAPDSRFYLKIAANSVFQRSQEFGQVDFRNVEDIDFGAGDADNRKVTVFSIDGNNNPLTYLVRKKVKLEAGVIKTIARIFTDPIRFSKIQLSDENVLGILSIVDSNGNEWSEVDYLAQDVIIDEKTNIASLMGSVGNEVSLGPSKIIKFKKTARRFVSRYNSDFKLEIIFGSGVLHDEDELITLDASKIASDEFQTRLGSTSLDPADFLSSNSFGLAPSNTALTITYVTGGGIESNVPANTITRIRQVSVSNDRDVFSVEEQPLFDDAIRSLAVNNPDPATGGKGQDSVEEIRQSTLAFFNSQNRLVTVADYKARVHAMSPRFGGIAKSFVIQDDQLAAVENSRLADVRVDNSIAPISSTDVLVQNAGNPRLINIYVLGFDNNKRLRRLNDQVKLNLKRYLSQFKMLTDDIQILDAFVVNIGIKFKVVVYKNKNVNVVLANAIDAVKNFFDISRWDVNQPIVLNDLYLTLASVEGVQSVVELEVFNRYAFKDGGDYENFRYDIAGNALDENLQIIFPSLDPMIFEVRFPDSDIIGRALQ